MTAPAPAVDELETQQADRVGPAFGQLGCLHCDALVHVGALPGGLRACCPRCGHVLSSRPPDAVQRALAWATAALVLLVLALSFPFLELRRDGIENVMSLPSAAFTLFEDGYGGLALLVLAFVIGAPAALLAMLLLVLLPLRSRSAPPWLVPSARLLFSLNNWSMVEVFIIGVIVSLVKIASMASVVLGISFWSYVGFAISFTAAVASLDRADVWRRIEACQA